MSELCWFSWVELRSGEWRWVEMSWLVVWVEMSWFEFIGDELRWVSCVESVELRVELCELRLANLSWVELSWDEWVVLSQWRLELRSGEVRCWDEVSCVSWDKLIWVEWSWVEISELCWVIWAELISGGVRWVELSWVVWVEMSLFELNGAELRWVSCVELVELSWDRVR